LQYWPHVPFDWYGVTQTIALSTACSPAIFITLSRGPAKSRQSDIIA
jgi:hypothetical protein